MLPKVQRLTHNRERTFKPNFQNLKFTSSAYHALTPRYFCSSNTNQIEPTVESWKNNIVKGNLEESEKIFKHIVQTDAILKNEDLLSKTFQLFSSHTSTPERLNSISRLHVSSLLTLSSFPIFS